MPACTNERTHFMNINDTLNSLKMYGQLIFPSLYFVVSTISINVGLEFSYVMRTKCLETFNYNFGGTCASVGFLCQICHGHTHYTILIFQSGSSVTLSRISGNFIVSSYTYENLGVRA